MVCVKTKHKNMQILNGAVTPANNSVNKDKYKAPLFIFTGKDDAFPEGPMCNLLLRPIKSIDDRHVSPEEFAADVYHAPNCTLKGVYVIPNKDSPIGEFTYIKPGTGETATGRADGRPLAPPRPGKRQRTPPDIEFP